MGRYSVLCGMALGTAFDWAVAPMLRPSARPSAASDTRPSATGATFVHVPLIARLALLAVGFALAVPQVWHAKKG